MFCAEASGGAGISGGNGMLWKGKWKVAQRCQRDLLSGPEALLLTIANDGDPATAQHFAAPLLHIRDQPCVLIDAEDRRELQQHGSQRGEAR